MAARAKKKATRTRQRAARARTGTTDAAAAGATVEELHSVFQSLYEQLTGAYWVATTIEGKDRIRGAADAIFDVLTELNREHLKQGTPRYREIKAEIVQINARLKGLKDEIDEIIHKVKVATDIAKGIDKAIEIAAKVFL
jgi:hypothetical protein